MATKYRQIAIWDETGRVPFERLQQIAAANEIQLNRDIGKVWDVSGVVRAFRTQAEIPAGWWTCTIVNSIPQGDNFNGIHWYTGVGDNRVPYAKAKHKGILSESIFEKEFTKVITEENGEMSVDPYGEFIISGADPEFANQTVDFLVELGDPVGALDSGYYINDVFVTNFIHPPYFYLTKQEGVKYDQLGILTEPKGLVEGGDQLFRRAKQWIQAVKINGKKYFLKNGEEAPTSNSVIIILGSVLFILALSLFFIFRKKKP